MLVREDGSKRVLAVNENHFNPVTGRVSVDNPDSAGILRNIRLQFFNSITKCWSICFATKGQFQPISLYFIAAPVIDFLAGALTNGSGSFHNINSHFGTIAPPLLFTF